MEEEIEDNNICRVCRSPSSETEPLFNPCKCSGSMKYIHQSCLEQWLKHSRKKSCDICAYTYNFIPIYSESAPKQLSLLLLIKTVAARIVKKLVYYFRILLASFAWILWVPYVSAWTWRFFLNPGAIIGFESQTQNETVFSDSRPELSLRIESFLGLPQNSLYLLDTLVRYCDWKKVFKSFLQDVFEGQIICAIVIIIVVVLLLIREYILAVDLGDDGMFQAEEVRQQPEIIPLQDLVEEEVEAPVNDDLADNPFEEDVDRVWRINDGLDHDIVDQNVDNNGLDPLIPNVDPENADLDMVINFGMADGEIVAQVEVNDVNAFLDLVGIQGTILKLAQTISLAHLIVMMILGCGVWMPYVIGSTALNVFLEVLVPFVNRAIIKFISLAQALSDPFIEPLADAILTFLNSTKSMEDNSLVNSTISERYGPDLVLSFFRLVGNQVNTVSSAVPYGPYHQNFFQAFREDLIMVGLGYLVLMAFILIFANRFRNVGNPFLQSLARVAQVFNNQLYSALKIMVFVVLELCCFPLYCGVLIDFCTLPVLSSQATVASRFALYQSYPWLFCFFHWFIGSTFMFHLAIYVATIREIFRPGVLWFLKDPNDPNFNAMRELLRRTVLGLVRKLFTGIVLYGTIVLGVVGGGVKLILFMDSIAENLFGSQTVLKVFPLRLEYYDTLSEMPFDLFFFNYILPRVIRWMKPDVAFIRIISYWFRAVSEKFRLSHFLMGIEREEEKSDFEENEEDRNLGKRDLTLRKRESLNRDNYPDQSSMDDELSGHESDDVSGIRFIPREQSKNYGRKRFMRVPNHDNIEIIPREKLFIPMDEEQEVFGRPHETAQEVAANWTKVYVPNHFYRRLWLLVYLHMFSFILAFPLVLSLPVVCGRFFFASVESRLSIEIPVPVSFNYTNPIISQRKELSNHDFYSFSAGICIIYGLLQVFMALKHFLSNNFGRIGRRNAIKRTRNGSTDTSSLPLLQKVTLFWELKVKNRLVYYLRAFYLLSVAGIILPLLAGYLVHIFIISPIQGSFNRAPIVFIGLEWATGSMLLRIGYNILTMAPARRISRIIIRAQADGVERMDLFQITKEVFFPLIAISLSLLSLPVISKVFDIYLGLAPNYLTNLVLEKGLVSLIFLYAAYNFLSNSYRSFIDWFDHLKDDQYLVGRILQNI